jgi:2-methylisocitrate lyase-like PEP mutase family enzyme
MPDIARQRSQSEVFRKMHHGNLLLLPNAWDVASARIIEDCGFGAIATTSAGVAFSMGYPDGQHISGQEMLAAIRRIASAVQVPVTADVEAGYGDRPEDAAFTARGVIESGGVGMNLEDRTGDTENPLVNLSLQIEKIKAVIEEARRVRVPIVLNARTDVYLCQVGPPENRYELALKRLAAFHDAGADCLFIPGIGDPETIRRFIVDLRHPINILAGPGSPPVAELEKLGVARVSLGSGPMRATLGFLRRVAEELKNSGTYSALEDAPSHAEVNRMMENE